MDNELLEMEVAETEDTATEESNVNWDDDFDDIDLDEDGEDEDEADTDSSDADQLDEDDEEKTPETTAEEQEQPEVETVEQPQEEHQFLTLKHLDDTKDIDLATDDGRKEITALAQKGMDYDRIRSERDSLKAEREELATYESFLKDLAESAGMSVDDLMIDTKARIVKDEENKKGYNITLDQAKYRVQSELKAARKARDEAKATVEPTANDTAEQSNGQIAKDPKTAKFDRFVKAYPELKGTDIPKEVWDEFGDGTRAELTDIYAKWQNKKLTAELDELKKSINNKKPRSTGSRHSNGSPEVDHDFDGFGDD